MADDERDVAAGEDSDDAAIVTEAKKRFRRCREWEQKARTNALNDTKFAEGDSRNNWQWDDKQHQARTKDGRPALTINKVRQACLQIINDQRQNKSQIRVRPVGDGASFPAAEVFEGVIRHIEYASNAMETYDSAAWHQITGGYGAWRVTTEYADDGSMDQDIFVRRIKDPNTVWLDPDIDEFDGSDARFGFVTKDLSRDTFKLEYPEWADKIPDGRGAFEADDAGWHDTDKVRVAEYFRRVEVRDTLHHVALPDDAPWPAGVPKAGVVRQSDVPAEHHGALKTMATRSRAVTSHRVEWFKVAGDKIVERGEWAGRYIPLVRAIGEETVLDGELDRKGHVRAMLDPQRMMNYYASQAVEFVAGQTKTPWIGAAEAFEGVETLWADPSTTRGYLPYNAYDEQGRQVERPERVQPPVSHPAASEGMDRAERQMMTASGQYQSQFGENENAKSGVAIQTRQRQGDNATYHYIDHMAQAQRFTGRILLDLIPKVYDTPRVIKIMAEDGEQSEIQVQPGAGVPHQQMGPVGLAGQMSPLSPEQVQAAQADKALFDKVKTIFDPTVGRYDVEADVGPSFGTKRQEAFNAMSQMMGQNQELMKVAGDLMFKAADFPMADEIAERLRRTVPPAVLGAAPPPALLQAQQQIQGLQGQLQKLLAQLHDKGQSERDASDKSEVENYRAETDRIKALAALYPQEFAPLVRGLLSDAMQTPIVPLMAAHALAEQTFGIAAPQPAPAPSGPAGGPTPANGGPGGAPARLQPAPAAA